MEVLLTFFKKKFTFHTLTLRGTSVSLQNKCWSDIRGVLRLVVGSLPRISVSDNIHVRKWMQRELWVSVDGEPGGECPVLGYL